MPNEEISLKEQTQISQEEFLKALQEMLLNALMVAFKKSKKPVNKEEAKNLLLNIAYYMIEKKVKSNIIIPK